MNVLKSVLIALTAVAFVSVGCNNSDQEEAHNPNEINMGEENQAMLAENLYHRCIASGIFISANNSKNTADLKSHRAQDLLKGIKDAQTKL